jgi:hypothetical protein
MVKLSDPVGPLATAQQLAGLGLNVLPARFKEKAPIVEWRKYQGIRTDSMLPSWFGGSGQRNYWIMTGVISGVIVIDCDTDAADAWWREQLGDDVMDAAGQVATRKGTHYWFKIPESWPTDAAIASWSVHPGKEDDATGVSFDVRADGTGVIAPPSTHESGHTYTWKRSLDEARTAPEELLDGSLRARAPQGRGATGDADVGGGSTRSMLVALLSRPPGGDGTGRNDWLARVAGHYAKTYHNMQDLYTTHCQQANQMMGTPLGDDEFAKTIDSVWRGEHTRNPERALDASCGWLKSGGTRIMTQVLIKDPQTGEKQFDLVEYADFDMVAKGVMIEEDELRTYWVTIRRKRRGGTDVEEFRAVLPGAWLGDERKLKVWLSSRACTILPPGNIFPREGGVALRLQRYLESQNPPVATVAKTLGWDADIIGGSGGFITHEGVITADEVFPPDSVGVIPNPALKSGGTAPHYYGFDGDLEEARRVLSEVLTFHDDDVTAVFGAWWAACLIKPQIEARTSLFPFMAIEAPSESGKTNGFFAQMIELNGNTSGEMNPTMASLRNIAAAHKNGIVWVDDLDDPSNLMELIRAATSGGTLAKMSEDRESIRSATIVSPIVISGEALGLGTQKALIDRAVMLKAGSPTRRMSYHEPGRPQWDDILALRSQYPNGLASVAGWLTQQALVHADDAVSQLQTLRPSSGRAGDKFAILRAGGRLLDAILGGAGFRGKTDVSASFASRVDAWVAAAAGSGSSLYGDNALTLELLPWALRKWQFKDKAYAGERAGFDTDTPAFVRNWDPNPVKAALFGEREPEVWFSPNLLAEAWSREKGGRIEKRTQTAVALLDQATALGAENKKVKIANSGARTAYYRRLSGEMALLVLERAQGA